MILNIKLLWWLIWIANLMPWKCLGCFYEVVFRDDWHVGQKIEGEWSWKWVVLLDMLRAQMEQKWKKEEATANVNSFLPEQVHLLLWPWPKDIRLCLFSLLIRMLTSLQGASYFQSRTRTASLVPFILSLQLLYLSIYCFP